MDGEIARRGESAISLYRCDKPIGPIFYIRPNNIGADALDCYATLLTSGARNDDFLLYLAGIYNSQIAEDYLEGGGANALRIPLTVSSIERGVVARVVNISRQLHSLHRVSAEENNGVDAELAESLVYRNTLVELGLEEVGGSGGRFRQRRVWRATRTTEKNFDSLVSGLRPQLDEAVSEFFVERAAPLAFI